MKAFRKFVTTSARGKRSKAPLLLVPDVTPDHSVQIRYGLISGAEEAILHPM